MNSEFKELENLEKDNSKRKRLPNNSVCYVCGKDKSYIKLRRFNEYCLCEKHYNQLINNHKITDPSPRKHKKSDEEIKCCVCGDIKMGSIEGKPYCRKHYIQMTRHNKLIDTIYDENEWVDYGDYYECILKNKNSEEVGRTKIDKEDYKLLKNFKLYMRKSSNKNYVYFSEQGTSKKYAVHRYLLGLSGEKYSIDRVVDHINGDSLDNRRSNLRICTQHQNSQNGRKKNKIVGVKLINNYNGYNYCKWSASICSNYKNIHIGYYNSYEEAAIARIKKEEEICGEYGPNKDLYYILNHPSPIEELKRVLSDGA